MWGWRALYVALWAVIIASCMKSGLYFSADMYPILIGYGMLCFFLGLYFILREAGVFMLRKSSFHRLYVPMEHGYGGFVLLLCYFSMECMHP